MERIGLKNSVCFRCIFFMVVGLFVGIIIVKKLGGCGSCNGVGLDIIL